jgi:hypothetical protein
MLIDIVTSGRLMKYECRVVKDAANTSSLTAPCGSASQSTLNQAIARCIIKCEGDFSQNSQTFILNAYDCFGETTLMHAAVINDLNLAR